MAEEVDEMDKKSIALFGVHQETKNLKPTEMFQKDVMSLDRKCLSCNPNSHVITKAFKMACLSYEPSGIFWNNQLYTRENFLKARREMLEQMGVSSDYIHPHAITLSINNVVPSHMFDTENKLDIEEIKKIFIKTNNKIDSKTYKYIYFTLSI